MRDDTPSFRLAPTPRHMSDAELAALFDLIESSPIAEDGDRASGRVQSDDGADGCAALPASALYLAERARRAMLDAGWDR